MGAQSQEQPRRTTEKISCLFFPVEFYQTFQHVRGLYRRPTVHRTFINHEILLSFGGSIVGCHTGNRRRC